MHRLFRFFLRPRFSLHIWSDRMLFWGGAVTVALTALAFAQSSVFGIGVFSRILELSPWLSLIITPLGLAGVVWLTRNFFVGSEGSGIPQTIAALKLPMLEERRKVLSLRVAVGKIVLTTIGLCCGASVGREGPSVQIGASILHTLGHRVHLRFQSGEYALIVAGAAAGISAAFNTPLAGIVFAIEELSRNFEQKTSGLVLSAVIMAGITSLALVGNYSYFGHTDAALDLSQAWKPALICGVAGGLLGGLFARILIFFSLDLSGRVKAWVKAHPVLLAALCGLGLGVVGVISGGTIYGTGYEEARSLIEGKQSLPPEFGLLKMIATILSYVSGIPGGIFAPSLAVGAGLGADIAPFLPMVPVGAVIILGMTGYFTGAVQAPITAVVIIMEMTDNQAILVPMMATALIAFGASRLICPVPLYRSLAKAFLRAAEDRRRAA